MTGSEPSATVGKSAARVIQRLPPSTRISQPPLVVRPGEFVEVGETSDEWPAFVFVTTEDGRRGWIPERILSPSGRMSTVLRTYDTTVLEPAVGESLEVLERDAEGGWLWCRNSRMREGWFPLSYVRFE
ncbi:MAG TPA: hypothetical protein VEE83_04160 [Thermoplasmata archaeon]|nr:hypothetical protein [Thermoplasmata archaeon]